MLFMSFDSWIKFKNFFQSFILGIIVGGSITGFVLYKYNNKKETNINPQQIIINPLDDNGNKIVPLYPNTNKITHDNWKFDSDQISFITTAEGKGKIETIVPKKYIPEYKYWKSKNNIIQPNIYIAYNNGKIIPLYGLTYFRRSDFFAFGGGCLVGKQFFGINVSAQLIF